MLVKIMILYQELCLMRHTDITDIIRIIRKWSAATLPGLLMKGKGRTQTHRSSFSTQSASFSAELTRNLSGVRTELPVLLRESTLRQSSGCVEAQLMPPLFLSYVSPNLQLPSQKVQLSLWTKQLKDHTKKIEMAQCLLKPLLWRGGEANKECFGSCWTRVKCNCLCITRRTTGRQ